MWPAVLDYGRDESLGILRRLELVMIMMINMMMMMIMMMMIVIQ